MRFEGVPGEFSQHDFGQCDVRYVDRVRAQIDECRKDAAQTGEDRERRDRHDQDGQLVFARRCTEPDRSIPGIDLGTHPHDLDGKLRARRMTSSSSAIAFAARRDRPDGYRRLSTALARACHSSSGNVVIGSPLFSLARFLSRYRGSGA